VNRIVQRSQVLTAVLLLLLMTQTAQAQFAGGNGGFGQGNQQNFQGGGIAIDASGVVQAAFAREDNGKLALKRLQSIAVSSLPGDVNKTSPLRKVSLVRLEEACRNLADQQKTAPPEMQFLAGINRIDYVFVYPDTKDIVIAGPAEGFAPNDVGRVVGTVTGRPPLRLDDLIIALRIARSGRTIGCSIDPVPENLARFNEYIRRNSSAATPALIETRFREMTRILGLQTVSVMSVPEDSHFAQALVEADYRMKLISIGLERPKLKGFKSHLEMVGRSGNTLQRWWFTPLYEPFQTSDEKDVFRFAGPRAQLLSQDELADAGGHRSAAPFTKVSTQRFSSQFTERFEELAAVSPVFAELQNLFDLAVLAALLEHEQLAQRVGWNQATFLNAAQIPLAAGPIPKQVASVFNARRTSTLVTALIAGGVEVNGATVLKHAPPEINPSLSDSRTSSAPPGDKPHWWWD